MGARYAASYVGKARAILTERDYEAVKKLVVDRCKGIYVVLEAERLEALIRELTDYEGGMGQSPARDHISSAFAAKEAGDGQPRQRWSDA